ncbi:unnamed protein product [Oikopleura dioica]|uniref:OTU domain-containing protein n=1 Tax=Oikopleura dioica TaxID=34765 RepID=E4XQ87_OIKDI|nr:unnamed protein product [Oikopleura dioica]
MGGLDNEIGVYGRCGECNQIVHAELTAALVYCSGCGTTSNLNSLKNARESPVCAKLLQHTLEMSKSLELVAFRGVHNFEAKLLSPFLSRYGMDRDGSPKLLQEMNLGEKFDCGLLANRHFRIKDKQKSVSGSGKDKTVYQSGYLDDTLAIVAEANRLPEALIAAHADPDGHCLVHAISRAISGTQLFWHPLRMSIKDHLQSNLLQYRRLMVNYVEDSEWPVIIDEADPCYLSGGATLGLRNIHVFALANVLKRPIILLDSKNGMGSVGDYSAIFLPVLAGPSKCRDKSNKPHPPIAIAWASPGRNHFIPILPKHNEQQIILPSTVLPPVWLVSQEDLQGYVTFKSTPSGAKGIQLGGGIEFSDGYLLKLVSCMRRAFLTEEKVQTSMIIKLFRDVYRETDCTPANITANYKKAMAESRLFICHLCGSIGEVDLSDLQPLGDSYEMIKEQNGYLEDNKTYQLPNNMTGIYVAEHDQLQLVFESSHPECPYCGTLTTSVKHKTMSLLDLKRRSASAAQRPTGKTTLSSESSSNISKKQKPIAETKSEVAGKSGNLRIKICLSDGQTDVMEFSSDVNTSTFLSLISQKFQVPVSTLAQIRSGHPPKVMDQTKSNSPVEFSNGDRVQITLNSSPESIHVATPMPSSGARIPESLQNSTGSSFIPESVKNFWKEAQSNKKTFFNALLDDIGTGKFTSLFQKNGGYAQLTENIKRIPLEEGQHYNLMNFQDVVFCWKDGEFQVCLGPDKHVPITDGFLYTVTTNDLKRNCISLNMPRTSELGPGISRISGSSSAQIIDKTDELARRLAENRKS